MCTSQFRIQIEIAEKVPDDIAISCLVRLHYRPSEAEANSVKRWNHESTDFPCGVGVGQGWIAFVKSVSICKTGDLNLRKGKAVSA